MLPKNKAGLALTDPFSFPSPSAMNLLPRPELIFIENGLARLGLRNLEAYYASKWWQAQLDWYWRTYPHVCARCPQTNSLQLHHKTYERLGRELDADLELLCKRCHHKLHRLWTRKVKRTMKKRG